MAAIVPSSPARKRARSSNTTTAANKASGRHQSEDNEQAFLIPGIDGRMQWGFPTKIITKIKYVDFIPLGPFTNLTPTGNIFRMNSIFDPDFSLGGHQPMWRDNYASIYENYRVLGSKITVKFCPSVWSYNGSFGPIIAGIVGSDDTTGFSSVASTLCEQNDSVWTMVTLDAGYPQLEYTYSPTKLGRDVTDDTMGASVSSNPSQAWFAYVWAAQNNSSSAPATTGEIIISVQIDYTVEFFELASQNEN